VVDERGVVLDLGLALVVTATRFAALVGVAGVERVVALDLALVVTTRFAAATAARPFPGGLRWLFVVVVIGQSIWEYSAMRANIVQ
jgi:hypothetical protein